MLYQLWEDIGPDGYGGLSLVQADKAQEYQDRGLLGETPVLVLEFEAATWEEACQRQYDHYGWGTYRPMEPGDG